MAAPGHAFAALAARPSGRPRSSEVRVSKRRPGCATGRSEEHPDRGRAERLLHAHFHGHLAHGLISRRKRRVVDHSEHSSRLSEIRPQFRPPVGPGRPLSVIVKGRQRFIKRIGVVERSAPYAGAGQHQYIAQEMDPLNAVTTQRRRPQEPAYFPGGTGQVGGVETRPGLEHGHAVTLFRQAQSRHRPAEPRADDYDVKVDVAGRNLAPGILALRLTVERIGHGRLAPRDVLRPRPTRRQEGHHGP